MKYQISYLNHYGGAQVLAEEILRYLPAENVVLSDLTSQEPQEEADVYLLCFEITKGSIPVEIMEILEYLEEKTVLLFVTCSAVLSENTQKIEKSILPFLPDECDYRGIFACPGQQPDEIFHQMQSVLTAHPNSQQAKAIMQNYQQCLGHPDKEDIASMYTYLKRNLDFDTL